MHEGAVEVRIALAEHDDIDRARQPRQTFRPFVVEAASSWTYWGVSKAISVVTGYSIGYSVTSEANMPSTIRRAWPGRPFLRK